MILIISTKIYMCLSKWVIHGVSYLFDKFWKGAIQKEDFSLFEMDTESHFHDWKTHAKFNVHALNIKL